MNINSNDKITKYPVIQDAVAILELRGLSKLTIRSYIDGIARFLDFINYDNSFEITLSHFQNYLFYLNSSELNKKTVNTNNSYLRFFFNAVLDIPVNTYKVPMARTVSKDIVILLDYQIQDLFDASSSDSRMDLIIKLGLCCGLRINEVCSLRISDIHTKGNSKFIHISESKRNKSRNIPMDNTVYRAIQRYAKEYRITPGSDDFLFHFSYAAESTNNETIRRNFYIYRDKANIPSDLTYHCLRHTFAVNYLQNSGDLNTLKYLLGHGSLATTSLYLKHTVIAAPYTASFIDKLCARKDGNL